MAYLQNKFLIKFNFKEFLVAALVFFLLTNISDAKGGAYSETKPDSAPNYTIDNSKNSNSGVTTGKGYGYKLGYKKFYISPEASPSTNSIQDSVVRQTKGGVRNNNLAYNLNLNLGYEFNRTFSAFVNYKVADFSVNNNAAVVTPANNSAAVIGSQVNFTNDFGVKFSYESNRFNSSSSNRDGYQIRKEIIQVGTVYNF